MPSAEAGYRNLILNQRVNVTNPIFSRTAWESCGGAPDPDAFLENEVFLGVDLSARNDLTAVVAVAKDVDGTWHTEPHFFVPQVGLQERSHRDRQPYDVWVKQGLITATPGSTVDYEYVARWLAEYCDEHKVTSIRFDRWRIDVLKSELSRLGVELPLQPFGQGFKDMTPAIDSLEGLVNEG